MNKLSLLRYCLLIIFFGVSQKQLLATHNRAGEIVIRQTGPLTIEATVITYTQTSSVSADRDSLTIAWGDGKRITVARQNGRVGKSGVPIGEELENDIKKNIYKATHTYAGLAPFYVISMTDPNRNAGVLNVNPPFSDNVPFSISTTFSFLSAQLQGVNNTPVLLQPPIDFGCVGEPFIHNPNAFDIDGDSLYYQLTEPRAAPGVKVPNYIYPNNVTSQFSSFGLNDRTGELIWNAPQRAGEYNVAIMIIEFRQGFAIDTLIRDMQILIKDNCKNKAPVLDGGKDICVVAGQVVEFKVTATDPDDSPKLQKVKLTALGGPLQTNVSPATFTVPTGFQNDPVVGTFRWQTACEHISNQYYNVVFKAVDNFLDTTGLATLRTIRIKVIAPPPKDLQATSTKGTVRLTWENPYQCDKAADNYFFGFSVWRKVNGLNLMEDTCRPGLRGKGYNRLVFKVKDIQNNRYQFIDNTTERGVTYCYRVQAEFTKLTSSNNPYNLVEGLSSKEVCVQLNRDLPLPLEVDVQQTDATNGQIGIRWNRPNPIDLDTLLNLPPYRYELQRANSLNGTYSTIYTATAATFAQAKDTFYVDKNLNTSAQQYFYKIVFYVNNENTPLGTSPTASSILLSIKPTDKANVLSWTEKTPWTNEKYAIFRKNDITNLFDSIGVTTQSPYRDESLLNGKSYCYYVKSIGAYSINGVRQPLLNRSQEQCAIPKDDVPPCAPTLSVKNICNDKTLPLSDTTLNHLLWNDVRRTCNTAKDLNGYIIHYSPIKNGNFTVIETLESVKDTSYNHEALQSLAGCYYIVAYDSLNNRSVPSDTVCVDNCPMYELPNTFTPNGDGQNDVFRPFSNSRFIAKVEFKVFNRWGGLVFETTDPHLNWTGKNLNDDELAAGVYFYTCKVFEQRIEGIVPRAALLKGYIQLLR